MEKVIKVEQNQIGKNYPTYFIADIAANHDGDIERAKDLIFKAADAGAHAAKFQHFNASTIVSDKGFNDLKKISSHQSKWKKSVFSVYEDASINLDWTKILKDTCNKANISFFSTPYSLDLIDHLDPYVPAYKIGSGDITWTSLITKISKKKKPIFLATGASNINEVVYAAERILKINKELCIMQCNTNYTGSLENFKYINLEVLNTFKLKFPNSVLGLSDHTPGHSTVLGAVALGARVIEKHFTDNNNRKGPDHVFSMNPKSWREMVDRTKELQLALGKNNKIVENNEKETVILQRRSLRSSKNIKKGTTLSSSDFVPLRPCPNNSLDINKLSELDGCIAKRDIKQGDYLRINDL